MTKVESDEFLKLIRNFWICVLVTSSHSALVLVLFTTFFCMVQIRSWEMSWVILISVPSSLSHPCPDSRCVHLVIHSEHARQFRVYQSSRFYMFTSLFEDYALEVPLLILRWCGFLGYMCPYWGSSSYIYCRCHEKCALSTFYLLTVTFEPSSSLKIKFWLVVSN